MEALRNYSWPGNVRELRNVIERSMILNDGPTLRVALPDGMESAHVREPARTLEYRMKKLGIERRRFSARLPS